MYPLYLMSRGRGESGDADEYDLEREFEDVAAIIDAIDESVILLGHSYGALCSHGVALQTDNIRKLILYEPPLPVGDHQSDNEDVLNEMESLRDDDKKE